MVLKAIFYTGEDGNSRVFFDEGVEVYWVDDRAPEDRVFKAAHAPIPDGILDGPIGYSGDASPAEARARRAVSAMNGEPHLKEVE